MILSYTFQYNLCNKHNSRAFILKPHRSVAWDCYYHSGKWRVGGGPDLWQQLCHLLLSSDNRWHETIRPAGLEEKRRVERRKDEKKRVHLGGEQKSSQMVETSECVCLRVSIGPTSNTYSLVSSDLCVTPLSTALSITAEKSPDGFTDD